MLEQKGNYHYDNQLRRAEIERMKNEQFSAALKVYALVDAGVRHAWDPQRMADVQSEISSKMTTRKLQENFITTTKAACKALYGHLAANRAEESRMFELTAATIYAAENPNIVNCLKKLDLWAEALKDTALDDKSLDLQDRLGAIQRLYSPVNETLNWVDAMRTYNHMPELFGVLPQHADSIDLKDIYETLELEMKQ